MASANCARYCGAKIDFVDIDIKTGLIDIENLKNKLENSSKIGKLPKLLIPVHLAGSSCNMREIYKLSKKYGFHIIEDASHAIGGQYLDKPVGNCHYSSITIFSFHPVKIITTGEGGVATTNNPIYAERMYRLRSHGITKDEKNFEGKNLGEWYYEQQSLGFNYRITDIQAALGNSQIKRLKDIVLRRNNLLSKYKIMSKGLPIRFLDIPNDVYSSVHLAIIQLIDKSRYEHKEIFSKLRSNNIGVQLHYLPVHLHPYYKRLGFAKGDFPAAEKYSQCSVSIPLFPELKKGEQIQIINTLERLLT